MIAECNQNYYTVWAALFEAMQEIFFSSFSSSSVVDQPCLDPQSTCCQELGGAAQVFRRSPQLVGG